MVQLMDQLMDQWIDGSSMVLHLDSEVLLVYRLFALFLAHLGVHAPTPDVQDAILNLRHPYIVVVVCTCTYTCTVAELSAHLHQ